MLLSAFLALALVLCISANSAIDTSSTLPAELTVVPTFAVEGHASLTADMFAPLNWQANSRVLLDYGKYTGFVKQDGSFVVESVPTGSYILEIANVDYIFEPIRVDINSKGKIRARKLNILQPNAVHTLPYPLRIQARQPTKYFRQREQWRITDALMNPMILMMLVGGVAMFLMPKLTANQDPEVQKELQEMSDPSKLLSNLFGGGGASNSAPKKSAITAGSSGGGRSAAEKSSGSQSQHKGAQRRQR